MTRQIPKRFDLVEDDGTPSPTRTCPFCGGRLTIGLLRTPEGKVDRALSAIHYARKAGSDATGCETYDRLELEDFLEAVIPRLLAAAALEAASRHRTGHA